MVSGRGRRPAGLTSVRRPNGSYGLPVSRFHREVLANVQGRNQGNQFHQPELAVQPTLRQPFPAGVTPALLSMRPDAPHGPAVEPVEQAAFPDLAEIPAPSANDRVDVRDQHPSAHRRFAPGTPTVPVLEVLVGLLTGKGMETPLRVYSGPAAGSRANALKL